MGCTELTDGVWVWPVGLAHYVEHHDVRLPDEFAAHAESVAWSSAYLGEFDDSAFDLEFWRSWCGRNARRRWRLFS